MKSMYVNVLVFSTFAFLTSCQQENVTPQVDALPTGSARASVQTEISISGNGVYATAHQTATTVFSAGRLESLKTLVNQAGNQIDNAGFQAGIPNRIKSVKIDFWVARNSYTISADGKSISGMPEAGTNILFKTMLKAYYLRQWTSSTIMKEAYRLHGGDYGTIENFFAQTVYAYTVGDAYQAPYNKAYVEKNMPNMAKFIKNNLMK